MTSELRAEVALHLPLDLSQACMLCFWSTQLQLSLSLFVEAGVLDLLVRLRHVFLHPLVVQCIASRLHLAKLAIYTVVWVRARLAAGIQLILMLWKYLDLTTAI